MAIVDVNKLGTRSPERKRLAAERRRRAVAMRVRGASYSEIGQALGISAPAAMQAVRKATAEGGELAMDTTDVDRLRRLELARLDALISHLWARMGRDTHASLAQAGTIGQAIVRAIETRARIAGLAKPDAVISAEYHQHAHLLQQQVKVEANGDARLIADAAVLFLERSPDWELREVDSPTDISAQPEPETAPPAPGARESESDPPAPPEPPEDAEDESVRFGAFEYSPVGEVVAAKTRACLTPGCGGVISHEDVVCPSCGRHPHAPGTALDEAQRGATTMWECRRQVSLGSTCGTWNSGETCSRCGTRRGQW